MGKWDQLKLYKSSYNTMNPSAVLTTSTSSPGSTSRPRGRDARADLNVSGSMISRTSSSLEMTVALTASALFPRICNSPETSSDKQDLRPPSRDVTRCFFRQSSDHGRRAPIGYNISPAHPGNLTSRVERKHTRFPSFQPACRSPEACPRSAPASPLPCACPAGSIPGLCQGPPEPPLSPG